MTFAGSPDRVESRLVPEAGFELDTFSRLAASRAGSGSSSSARSGGPCARRSRACASSARRRPDVVLGGGGYVAGPMVLAARLTRHPGGADARRTRTSASPTGLPRRSHAVSSSPTTIPGRDGAKYRVVGRPIPRATSAPTVPQARARFGLAAGPAGARRLRRARRRAGAERVRGRDLRRRRASRCCTSRATRDFPALSARGSRASDYVLLPTTDRFGDALAAADLAVSRAGGTVWELAAAGTPAILVPYPHATADHQSLNARHFERGGGAVVVRQDGARRGSRARRRAARRSRPAAADERGDARRSRGRMRRTRSPTS